MPVTLLDDRTAVVLIDLQKGITALPTAHPVAEVAANAARLAGAARERGLPVVRVRVAFSPDGGDVLRARTDAPGPAIAPAPDFAEYDERVPDGPTDIRITKRGWDAFHGTELDLQLRRREITGIVLAGISTSIGVESTARGARERGYEIAVASDAVTDLVASAHENSLGVILPRIAQIDTTEGILAAFA
ncbi:isochorismatase family protein [Microbispora siamensis]